MTESKAISFRASGKLMLTGEYAVLDGATSWAVPTQFGQNITCTPRIQPGITWTSINHLNEVWFEAEWNGLGVLTDHSNEEVAHTLDGILQYAQGLNSTVFSGWDIEIEMDFPREWGLGSSSSLVALIGHWLNVDPYLLFENNLTGSGYDVAVAYNNCGVLYNLDKNGRTIELSNHVPSVTNQLYFAYSGVKQSSASEVKSYTTLPLTQRESIVPQLNELTQTLYSTTSFIEFSDAVREHERILGTVLERKTMNEKWPTINGAMKHLGAWGGDFFLLATQDPSDLEKLKNGGIDTLFSWNEIML